MSPEIPREELLAALDACVAELLDKAGVSAPPVDALDVAFRLGFIVARDESMTGRARLVRLAVHARCGKPGMILIGREDRHERQQWAVAHELGEAACHGVFSALGLPPDRAAEAAREQMSNGLAGRLLVPKPWFIDDARRLDWDLPELKARYATASHELLARRLLDLDEPPVIVTLFDQGRCTWRRSNFARSAPELTELERGVWRQAHLDQSAHRGRDDRLVVQGWPIHEPHWKREIVRTEVLALE